MYSYFRTVKREVPKEIALKAMAAFSSELPYMAREYDAETEETMRYCMHCGSRLELQGGAEMGGGEQE